MKVHHAVKHSVDFLLLFAIILLGLGGLLFYRFDIASQVAIVVIMATLYVFWGVIHHLHDHSLNGKVVLEYVAMAGLIAALLIVFLIRV